MGRPVPGFARAPPGASSMGCSAVSGRHCREARSSLLTTLQSAPQLITYLHNQNTWVRSIAFSPDGQTFASAGADGQILIWDANTRQPSYEINTQPVAPAIKTIQGNTLSFSPMALSKPCTGNGVQASHFL